MASCQFSFDNFTFLSNFAQINHILLFSNLSSLTEFGLGFSIDNDYFDMGLKTGKLLNEIILNFTIRRDNYDIGIFFVIII